METQPNFEKVKIALYQRFLNSPEHIFGPLFTTIKTKQKKYYNEKIEEQKKEANKIIDTLDIRSVSNFIDELQDSNLPRWIKRKQFIINYNKYGVLDLIKL